MGIDLRLELLAYRNLVLDILLARGNGVTHDVEFLERRKCVVDRREARQVAVEHASRIARREERRMAFARGNDNLVDVYHAFAAVVEVLLLGTREERLGNRLLHVLIILAAIVGNRNGIVLALDFDADGRVLALLIESLHNIGRCRECVQTRDDEVVALVEFERLDVLGLRVHHDDARFLGASEQSEHRTADTLRILDRIHYAREVVFQHRFERITPPAVGEHHQIEFFEHRPSVPVEIGACVLDIAFEVGRKEHIGEDVRRSGIERDIVGVGNRQCEVALRRLALRIADADGHDDTFALLELRLLGRQFG